MRRVQLPHLFQHLEWGRLLPRGVQSSSQRNTDLGRSRHVLSGASHHKIERNHRSAPLIEWPAHVICANCALQTLPGGPWVMSACTAGVHTMWGCLESVQCANKCYGTACATYSNNTPQQRSCQQGCLASSEALRSPDDTNQFCHMLSLPNADFGACEAGVHGLMKCLAKE